MTKEKRIKLSKNLTLSIYHFFDNINIKDYGISLDIHWNIKKRFKYFDLLFFSLGWENFGRGNIFISKTKNFYFEIFCLHFTILYKKR